MMVGKRSSQPEVVLSIKTLPLFVLSGAKSGGTKEPHVLPGKQEMGRPRSMKDKIEQQSVRPMPLERRHALQASVLGEAACIAKVGKRSILIDAKNANRAGT